jgi:hypothetical protein
MQSLLVTIRGNRAAGASGVAVLEPVSIEYSHQRLALKRTLTALQCPRA